MAFISKFKSDTAYSNVDINEALSVITSEGVLPLAPNDILSNIAGEGVTLSNECCQVSWADDQHTQIKIGAGAVIMSDGSYIIIADEIFPIAENETNYVFIYSDLILQNVPKCETSLPDDDRDYVLLATIQNGNIYDKRRLATSKISNFGAHPTLKIKHDFLVGEPVIPAGKPVISLDIGEGYTHAIISKDEIFFVVYNFESDIFEYASAYSKGIGFDTPTFNTNSLWGYIRASFQNGILNIYSSQDLNPLKPYESSVTITIF